MWRRPVVYFQQCVSEGARDLSLTSQSHAHALGLKRGASTNIRY